MIVNPDKFIEDYHRMGADILNVHVEACTHLHRTIQKIKSLGMKAGVTLNPHTSLASVEEILPDLDVVMLMSVNPGFGGQKFIENTLDKTSRLKELIGKRNSNALIEIDGGVNFETGEKLLKAGADVLVAGSFVFGASDPIDTIEKLKVLA
jgi:ribulose-phosphate 3-epimerase